MSRRSAVATATGTTGATFARAEAGLGSPPPQADKHTLSKRMSPGKKFATRGCRQVERCPSCAAPGLPAAVGIRRPRAAEKYDEFSIIVVVLSLVPNAWTLESQLRLRNIAPRMYR